MSKLLEQIKRNQIEDKQSENALKKYFDVDKLKILYTYSFEGWLTLAIILHKKSIYFMEVYNDFCKEPEIKEVEKTRLFGLGSPLNICDICDDFYYGSECDCR